MYQAYVTTLTHRLLGWSDETEDVVQEVFFSVHKHLKKFRHESSLKTWITTITINKCRSYHRRQKIKETLMAGLRQNARQQNHQLQNTDKHEQLKIMIQKLKPKYREVIIMRYLEEMELDQIETVTGLSKSLINVRLHRGKKKLKEVLDDGVD